MNISRVSRKVLPLATSAAIGLGALTACSSSNNKNAEPNYYQTEVTKLDNTLDSLKMNKGDGVKGFYDYYDKSKAVINNAKLDGNETKNRSLIAYSMMALGFWGMLLVSYAANRLLGTNSKIRKATDIAAVGFTLLSFGCLGGAVASVVKQEEAIRTESQFEKYKEVKLEKLEKEQTQFIKNLK